ncbi:MAG TPA: multicopper oxidase domain-containing protein [Gammaproteobacteria bacterium]|nr:multicopper oxidase domain-containing protein [Gammaproteobacteria bacterium]
MNVKFTQPARLLAMATMLLSLACANLARAEIDGITDPTSTFNLSAEANYIATPDGGSTLIWGFADQNGGTPMQYPGPTLIVKQGDTVTVNLTNNLSVPVSIVFPGQAGVTASGGAAGLLTNEAAPAGGTVQYSFTATNAGTYMYHSGTNPQLQMDMGLVGALIVRPTGYDASTNKIAYGHPDTKYDHEYLFFLTEMDVAMHDAIDQGRPQDVDNTSYHPTLWFINGRNGPDTMSPAGQPWLPHQPYSALARIHPGEKLLLRVIGGGRDTHPFHTHGNDFEQIGRDGRMLQSAPGAGPDLQRGDYTMQTVPGATYEAIFQWTGRELGWDIYGTPAQGGAAHTCNGLDTASAGFDPVTHEYCPDHGKPLPVVLPETQDLTFGGFYSGSPFLGGLADLPPGEGGLNLYGGMFFMWHSHNAVEQVNNDIFPGGMTTMLIVEPPGVPIP